MPINITIHKYWPFHLCLPIPERKEHKKDREFLANAFPGCAFPPPPGPPHMGPPGPPHMPPGPPHGGPPHGSPHHPPPHHPPPHHPPMVHPGVTCDGCEGRVAGTRFKCTVCPDYDLCSSCQAKGLHKEHPLLPIWLPMNNMFEVRTTAWSSFVSLLTHKSYCSQ